MLCKEGKASGFFQDTSSHRHPIGVRIPEKSLSERGGSILFSRTDEDGASERSVSEESRAATRRHHDVFDRSGRQLIPLHVTGEWIVERDPVEQDKRATGSARAEIPQGNALRGRIGDAAAAPAKETEARDLGAENIVQPKLW